MKNKKATREGQIGINNQGIKMKIIQYRKANDIDVEFLNDNYIVKNKRYEHFINGNIKHPNYKDSLFINRVGERRQNKDGDWMEIIECFGSNNNTVKFDDGSIKLNVNWQWFDKGIVSHPIRYSESLLYLYPNIAKIISIPENEIILNDCSNIYPNSKNKYYTKCPYCNKISSNKKFLYYLTTQGFSCEYCSDGISIPNKILRQISKQLDLNWVFEYSEKWMGKYKFDAYDKTLKQPIEMDAEFFITKNSNKITDNHRGERKEIDNWKDNEAIKHNMNKPRRIDLMDSKKYNEDKFNYIKQQIYLAIGDLYNLDKIDWNKIFIESQKSLMIEACRLWENGVYSTIEISKILKISHNTSLNYLKQGNILGLCDYTKDKAIQESAKKRTGTQHPNANLYIVIKPNGEKYIDKPLCSKDIYDKGFLKVHHDIFNKYIKPYGKIDIKNIKYMGASKTTIEKLISYDGWQFILLKEG